MLHNGKAPDMDTVGLTTAFVQQVSAICCYRQPAPFQAKPRKRTQGRFFFF